MRPSWIAGRARFNAPDLKSDERSNVPGVRIPRYPPHLTNRLTGGFFISVTVRTIDSTLLCIATCSEGHAHYFSNKF